MPDINRFTAGVTLVELALVITIMPLIITSFVLVLDKTLADARHSALQANYDGDSAFAADWLEHDIRLAAQFNTDISSQFSDPYEPGGGWDYSGSGSNDRVLILSLPATTVRDGSDSRDIVHEDSGTYNCTTELVYNPILTYRAVYFVDNGTLYKRTLTDTTTATCNSQVQKQSCPAADIGSWPTICEARDEVLVTDVSQFSVNYYPAHDTDVLPDQYTGSEPLNVAQAAEITLTISEPGASTPVTSKITLKTSKVN